MVKDRLDMVYSQSRFEKFQILICIIGKLLVQKQIAVRDF